MEKKIYKLVCRKHGVLWGEQWLRLGSSLFCPHCLAEYLSREIGELERVEENESGSISQTE